MKHLKTFENFINENEVNNINETIAKQLEPGLLRLIKHIEYSYDHVSPEEVQHFASGIPDFKNLEWEDIGDTIYKRLAKEGLLLWFNPIDRKKEWVKPEDLKSVLKRAGLYTNL